MSVTDTLLAELRIDVAFARANYAFNDAEILHLCEAFKQLDELLRSGAPLPEDWRMRDVRQASNLDLLRALAEVVPKTEDAVRRNCIPSSSYCAMCDEDAASETHKKECEGR